MCKSQFFTKRRSVLFSLFGVVLILEIIAIVSVYYFLHNRETSSIKTDLDSTVNDILYQTAQTMEFIEHNINRDSAFFRIKGPNVTKSEYLDHIHIETNPISSSVESYFWVPKVLNSEKDQYNSFCNKNILPGCFLKEFNGTQFIPVLPRSAYYPISYSSPSLASGDLLIGFDLASNAGTAIYAGTALSSINVTASVRVVLTVRANNPNSYGTLLSKVSLKNIGDTSTSNINGIMMAIVNLDDIITRAISDRNIGVRRDDVDILVFDKTVDGLVDNRKFNISLLFKENNPEYKNVWFDDEFTADEFSVSKNFTIAKRIWNIKFKFLDKYIESKRTNTVMIVITSMTVVFVLFDIIIGILCELFEKDKKNIANKMLNYVNHEIRNPLNVINGMVELAIETFNDKLNKLQNGNVEFDKEEAKVFVSDLYAVTSSCEIMKHIVNDILDIRKLEEDKLIIDPENLDMSRFIKNIHRTIIPRLREKPAINFTIQFENDIDKSTVYIDKNRLVQLLLNFLSNSIKFTVNGTITLRIYKPTPDTIKFECIDTGRGIPEEAKSKIFRPFQQTSQEDTSRHGGVGLGLHLCKMLAECMGGKIGFISEFGKGSTFWVQFKTKFAPVLDEVIVENK